MPIIKRTERAGPLVLETIYTGRVPRSIGGVWSEPVVPRSPKAEASDERQQSSNQRSSRRRFELLLAANFGFAHSYLLTLSWGDYRLPSNRSAAVSEVRSYIRRVNYRARAAPWRYAFVIEEQHGEGRMHSHMLVHGRTLQQIQDISGIWSGGSVDWEPLDSDRWHSYRDLASYLLKEQGTSLSTAKPGQHLWHTSRSMIRPEPCYTVVEHPDQMELPPDAYVIERHEVSSDHGTWIQRLYVLEGYDQDRYRKYYPNVEELLCRRSMKSETDAFFARNAGD